MSLRRTVAAAGAIAGKDLRIEWRRRTALITAVAFAVLVELIFVFAREPGEIALVTLAPSVLWITLSLAGMVVLNRSFMLEREHQALDGILLAPISRVAIYWGKWLANLALVTLVTLVAFPVWIVFFNVEPTGALWSVLAVALLAAAGFCAVGTLFAAMTARTRNGELLLPVLLLPFLIPPVFAGVQVTVRLLGGRPADELFGWVRIVVIFDLVFLLLASWLFTEVVDE